MSSGRWLNPKTNDERADVVHLQSLHARRDASMETFVNRLAGIQTMAALRGLFARSPQIPHDPIEHLMKNLAAIHFAPEDLLRGGIPERLEEVLAQIDVPEEFSNDEHDVFVTALSLVIAKAHLLATPAPLPTRPASPRQRPIITAS